MQPADLIKLPGIDASHYQGVISWVQLSKQIRFAFLKATDGLRGTDAALPTNAAGARDNGVPFGLYHFFRNSAVSEADHFLSIFSKYPSQLPPVLDLEVEPDSINGLDDNALAFLERVSAVTQPMVYVSPSYARTNLGENFLKYPLWIAHYTSDPQPDCAFWPTYAFWQWKSNGRLDGIEGDVDLDWCRNQTVLDSLLRLPT